MMKFKFTKFLFLLGFMFSAICCEDRMYNMPEKAPRFEGISGDIANVPDTMDIVLSVSANASFGSKIKTFKIGDVQDAVGRTFPGIDYTGQDGRILPLHGTLWGFDSDEKVATVVDFVTSGTISNNGKSLNINQTGIRIERVRYTKPYDARDNPRYLLKKGLQRVSKWYAYFYMNETLDRERFANTLEFASGAYNGLDLNFITDKVERFLFAQAIYPITIMTTFDNTNNIVKRKISKGLTPYKPATGRANDPVQTYFFPLKSKSMVPVYLSLRSIENGKRHVMDMNISNFELVPADCLLKLNVTNNTEYPISLHTLYMYMDALKYYRWSYLDFNAYSCKGGALQKNSTPNNVKMLKSPGIIPDELPYYVASEDIMGEGNTIISGVFPSKSQIEYVYNHNLKTVGDIKENKFIEKYKENRGTFLNTFFNSSKFKDYFGASDKYELIDEHPSSFDFEFAYNDPGNISTSDPKNYAGIGAKLLPKETITIYHRLVVPIDLPTAIPAGELTREYKSEQIDGNYVYKYKSWLYNELYNKIMYYSPRDVLNDTKIRLSSLYVQHPATWLTSSSKSENEIIYRSGRAWFVSGRSVSTNFVIGNPSWTKLNPPIKHETPLSYVSKYDVASNKRSLTSSSSPYNSAKVSQSEAINIAKSEYFKDNYILPENSMWYSIFPADLSDGEFRNNFYWTRSFSFDDVLEYCKLPRPKTDFAYRPGEYDIYSFKGSYKYTGNNIIYAIRFKSDWLTSSRGYETKFYSAWRYEKKSDRIVVKSIPINEDAKAPNKLTIEDVAKESYWNALDKDRLVTRIFWLKGLDAPGYKSSMTQGSYWTSSRGTSKESDKKWENPVVIEFNYPGSSEDNAWRYILESKNTYGGDGVFRSCIRLFKKEIDYNEPNL